MADLLPPVQEDDKMLSGAVYPLWPFMVPIVLYGPRREEAFVNFHARQALALGVLSLGSAIVLFLLTWLVMFLLPGKFVTVSGFMGLGLFAIVIFCLFMYLMTVLYIAWRAASGAFFRLPFIGRWAEAKMQADLGITDSDYASDIIGEKRRVELRPFDYQKYLDEETSVKEAEEEKPRDFVETVDGFEYEYEGGAVSSDISDYTGERIYDTPPYNPTPRGAKAPTLRSVAASQAETPEATAAPASPAQVSEPQFKPLSERLRNTSVGAGPGAPAKLPGVPKMPGVSKMPGSQRAGAPGKMPGASRNFVWKEDFSAPSPKPEAEKSRQDSQNSGDFRPGLPAANKPGHRFKWD
nr:DUF4870 domain-containing protein [bacterium]